MRDLRHTSATILFGGASAPDVQTALGRSSLQITERDSCAREGVARGAGSVLDGLFDTDTKKKPQPRQNHRANAE